MGRLDHVLLIDDSPLALNVATSALEPAGFSVITATNGLTGLEALTAHHPDIVLCDLVMPVMGGLDLLVEAQRHAPSTPVVMFSETSDAETAIEAMRRGAAGFIFKGATDAELAEQVRSALEGRRELERKRAQLDKLATLGTLSACVAHEINNPLSFVVANVAFARAALEQQSGPPLDAPGRAELAEALREAELGLERVARIARDIKSLGRTDGPKELLDLAEVLGVAARMAAPVVKGRATLNLEIGELPPVLGQAGRLSQVVINLLINAAQACAASASKSGQVRLVARLDASRQIVVEVRDTGCGMSAEVMRRLFEPFFTTKPRGVGTGLGLSICQAITAEHGGTLTAQSEEGRGSTFTLRLPAAAVDS